MDVLVTGATGFLGREVVRALCDAGQGVRALVRTPTRAEAFCYSDTGARPLTVTQHLGALEDERSLHNALRGADAVIHCAAHLGGWSRADGDQRRVNVEGTAALLRAAERRGVTRFVHVSTIAAVGFTREPRPMDEDEPWMGARGPQLGYALTKREAEERVFAASRAGLPAVVVNPTSLVGRNARGAVRGGNCAAAFAGRLRRAIPGGGSVVAVEDVARSCVLTLTRGAIGRRYILGGTNVTWRELGAAAAEAAGQAPPIGAWPVALGGVLARATGALDVVGLSRPRFAPERFRTWGWYTFADGRRAEDELGHVSRPLEALLAALVT